MISFSAVFVKLAHVGPTMAGFYRVLFGGLLLLGILFATGRMLPKGIKPLAWLVLCGFIFAVDISIWHRSVHYLGPGLSTLLGNFQVVLMAACGVLFLGERLSGRLIAAVLLSLLGLFLVFGCDLSTLKGNYGLGVLFGLLTAIMYAAFLLTLRKARKVSGERGSIAAMAMVSFAATPLAGLGSWCTGESFAIPDVQSWLSLIAYGAFSQVVGWVLITNAISKIPVSRAGLILLLQPTLALVWDYLFFSKPVFFLEVLGATVVIYAIYLGSQQQSDQSEKVI